ncbi:uncharacterized protein TNCV_30821 [Trichonephila clavipes]|nr:uncharacterized protein TNCV_30821 [Trichonephila clavipes]
MMSLDFELLNDDGRLRIWRQAHEAEDPARQNPRTSQLRDVWEQGIKGHHTAPTNITELWTAWTVLANIWLVIPVERFKKLVESMPRRVAAVIKFSADKLFTLPQHPPYSQDLTRCDFYLFIKMKNALKGTHFESIDEVKAKTANLLKMVTPNEAQSCFERWKTRMQLCMDREGEYFKTDEKIEVGIFSDRRVNYVVNVANTSASRVGTRQWNFVLSSVIRILRFD